jgi:hypothetical protein
MNDDKNQDPEWITIDEASQLLATSPNKLLKKLHDKDNTLRLGRTASGLLINADDVRREVERRSSESTISDMVKKQKGEKTPAGERPFISFEGSGKTYHFL